MQVTAARTNARAGISGPGSSYVGLLVGSVRARAGGAATLNESGTFQNLASLMPASWNQIVGWLKQIDKLRQVA